MRKILAVALLLSLLIIFSACESVTPAKVDTSATTASTAKNQVFAIGDTIQAGDHIFTVNSVREDKGSEFIKPKDGNIYYIIDVTVDNKTDKSINVSSIMMFKLFDSEGYNYNITIGPETKGSVDGEIAAGRKLRGELIFEIPAASKGLELEIDPTWGSGKAIIKLDR